MRVMSVLSIKYQQPSSTHWSMNFKLFSFLFFFLKSAIGSGNLMHVWMPSIGWPNIYTHTNAHAVKYDEIGLSYTLQQPSSVYKWYHGCEETKTQHFHQNQQQTMYDFWCRLRIPLQNTHTPQTTHLQANRQTVWVLIPNILFYAIHPCYPCYVYRKRQRKQQQQQHFIKQYGNQWINYMVRRVCAD